MKRFFITMMLCAAATVFGREPTGTYELYAHGDFMGGAETNSVALSHGTLKDGRCQYMGKINLPARNGECESILVLHLYAIRGGEYGLSCTYDRSIFGNEIFDNGNYRKHCPDILAVRRSSLEVLAEYDFGRDDNQADYWSPSNHCGFSYDIEPKFLHEHPELQEQIAYRFLYDWKARKQYAKSSYNSNR